jgi:SAM-dependent methyltransferase
MSPARFARRAGRKCGSSSGLSANASARRSPELAARLAERGPRLIVRLAPLAETLGPAPCLVGDEEILPFAPESFDLVASTLALQHANDLPGALVQIRRALKPDGLFLGCLLGGQSLNELRTALAIAESELCGGISPRVAPFADIRDMGALLQRAGFALPVADSEPLVARYADMFGLMADLRAMGATNPLEARARRPTPRRLFARAAQIYAERFGDPDGRVRATFELIFLSGWAPHESQQKPLAPGSAKMRLAEALKPDRRS